MDAEQRYRAFVASLPPDYEPTPREAELLEIMLQLCQESTATIKMLSDAL